MPFPLRASSLIMRPMTRLSAALLCLAVALFPGGASAQPAAAPALRIHVRGGAELHAVAGADHGELTVRGELIDDAGGAIADAPIVVQAASAEGARGPVRLGPLTPCEGGGRGRGGHLGVDDAVVETDERGGFCATARVPAGKLSLKLRFRGEKLHDAVEIDVPIEEETDHLQRALLRFEPPPETIDLDRESVTVTASLRVELPAARALSPAGSAQRANLGLVLEDERHAHVAEAATGGDGRARFDVKTAALDGPGPGELKVRFGGNAVLGKAEEVKPIIRRADARVALSHPIGRADADDGVPIDVDVSTARGPVSGGVVEVLRTRSLMGGPGGDGVGAGTVDEHGHAHIVATFPAGGLAQVPLVLRYVPAAPWYRAGPELRVDVELSGPGVLRQALLAAVVIGAAAWVASGWRRAPRPPVAPGVEGTAAPPSGRAGVHVVASPANLAGWRGTIVDAHDNSPVAGARLTIIAPAFAGDGAVAHADADERGAFVLEGAHRSDARLVVTARDHAAHEQALPPPSVLRITLVTRRRALLERLVRWAKQKGAPFDSAPEATPGHVRRAAGRAAAGEVEAWAGAVEAAAYGPDPVDEAVERDLKSAEPRALR
jgi:hypothetical protein